jgi:flagellar basal-body rod modification protein FlgD
MLNIYQSKTHAPDAYVEQLRQKLGTDFSDRKASGKKRNELGKDDFIKLMSAQLKHQDPLSPMKNEEMAAQLAQFSALEQMVNVNTNLEKMAAGQKPQENVLAASLIGKRIMTDSSKFMLQKGEQPEIKFDLPADAATVNVSVVDNKGEIVREFELGSMAKGAQAVRWDGKNGKSQEVPVGEYSYRVTAADAKGTPVTINTTTAGLVSGVSFEGGKALLLVEGKKIPMEAVGQIAADAPKPAANPLTAGPQNPLKAEESPEPKKTTQDAKNALPNGLSPEKIKNMLSALGPVSRKEGGEESAAQPAEGEKVPYPLWNPANL